MSAVRERTRRHLARLSKGAALAGVASQLCYCVVDMLPEPVECASAGKGDWVTATSYEAVMVQASEVSPRRVRLSLFVGGFEFSGLSFGTEAIVSGGTGVELDGGGTESVVIEFTPEEGVLDPTVDIELRCGGEGVTLHAALTISPDTGEDEVMVEISEG